VDVGDFRMLCSLGGEPGEIVGEPTAEPQSGRAEIVCEFTLAEFCAETGARSCLQTHPHSRVQVITTQVRTLS
jgi:hypothetical protein